MISDLTSTSAASPPIRRTSRAPAPFPQKPVTTAPEAIRTLAHIHRQFPFLEGRIDKLLALHSGDTSTIQPHEWPRSYRVHIAAMVTMVASALLKKGISRLGFAYNANAPRSGKTLLAKLAIALVYGWTQVRTWPVNDRKRTDESEIRKALDAIAIEGTPYVLYDNVKGTVSSETLEAFMTAPRWTGRVMGTQKTFEADVRCTVLLTGNNLSLSTDNMARFLLCDLMVEEVEAQDRPIEEPIEEHWIIENQHLLKDCILALIFHWVQSGMPKSKGRIRRGFETWSHTIGGIIQCAGLGDIFEPRHDEDSTSGSPDDNNLRRLCHTILGRLDPDTKTTALKFDDIVAICHQQEILTHYLDGKVETVMGEDVLKLTHAARSRFGNFLKRYAPTQRGRTWTFIPPPQATSLQPPAFPPAPCTLRLQTVGTDRTREYHATLEITPANELLWRLHAAGRTWQHLIPILEQNDLPATLEELTEGDIALLLLTWKTLILPSLK